MKPSANATTLNVIDALDARTSESVAIKKWRADLLNDLGGEKDLPLMARELVEQATRLKVLLDRMDAALLPKPGETLAPRDRRMQVRKMLIDIMSRLELAPKGKDATGKKSIPSLEAIRARYNQKRRRPA